MGRETTPPEEPRFVEGDRTDSFDLECAERVRIGVTRGETDLELGPPRDYPDRADVSVRPESADEHRVVLSIDAMAGDHGTGHADVELTPTEARTLRDRLGDIVRWMTEDDDIAADAPGHTDSDPDDSRH
ncbi:hypothetical protein [Natrinema altunense]|uniref:Uncharacterized protein n=1 Tax=Natrinema altunense TaxID=222984 RepID=A0A482Y1X4_9EURY|nr:hypothetical protein [Natrinema altunense]RZH68105.1 hypothetical protein ELS17_01145 [Natrinema altunense]